MPDRPQRRPIPGASAPAAPTAEQPTGAAPTRQRPARPAAAASRANAGWGAVETLASADGFITPLKITEEPMLMKFLEAAPFDVMRQHWFDNAKGQKGWRCQNEDGASPCLLCDQLGDDPQGASAYFNVMAFLAETPTLEVLRAPKGLTADIKKLNEDSRFKGLTDPRLYVAVHKKVEGEKRISYPSEIVRARDLKEEWGVDEPDAALVGSLIEACHTDPIVSLRDDSAYQDLIDELLKQG